MSKILFLNKHQIIFEIKTPDQIFKTPIGKLILVWEMNCVYEIAQGFKDVFMSLYKKTLLIRWIMLSREHDWMTNSLFHWNLGKEVQQQRSYANMNTIEWFPSTILILSFRTVHFSKPSSFTILPFWDSFFVESMVNDILIGYAGWKCMACWNSDDTLFAPRFCGLKWVTCISSGWAISVAFPNLSLKVCSSRLVSLATSSLRLSISFWCWASNWALSSFSIYLFLKRLL